MNTAVLSVDKVSVHARQKKLLSDVSFKLHKGECVALLGANGAGKTSLLKTLLGIYSPTSGNISLSEQPLSKLSVAARARYFAYLPQARELTWPMSIESVIGLGINHSFNPDAGMHQQLIAKLMADCQLSHLQGQSTQTLSGGELARVHIARMFASKAPILLADEPIAELDPLHQYKVLELVAEYVKQGNSAIVALHDIALAAQFAQRIIVLKQGAMVAQGSADIIKPALLADIYGINASVETHAGYSVLINRGPASTI